VPPGRPSLIQSNDAMKCLLDSMLVLTKQDRLCHVIHATSDPFYQTWLRQFNVMQHCKVRRVLSVTVIVALIDFHCTTQIITIGDCSRSETKSFYRDTLLPRVPERLRPALDFEVLYDAFGGKLAHWHDYITDYSEPFRLSIYFPSSMMSLKLTPMERLTVRGATCLIFTTSDPFVLVKQSSHFLQAHALLNLHIIHSSQSPGAQEAADTAQAANTSNPETLHPGLGPAGFKIYSPLTHPHGPSANDEDRSNSMVAGHYAADFTAMQLLKVMSRLTQPDAQYLPYFLLCRELGVRAVDGMVKGRVLDLRWTETVTKEIGEEVRVRSSAGFGGGQFGPGSSGTAVEMLPQHSEEGMVPVSEFSQPRDMYEEVMEVIGPKLVPTTPIMRFAMRDVVQEYEDNQSVSEYASLSDVDEY
jgi:hypothetical protein